MGAKISLKESIAYYSVKLFGALVRLLPIRVALGLGRLLGGLIYYIDARHRATVYLNLKIAFSQNKSLKEINNIAKRVFQNFGQNFIELLRLPAITDASFRKYIHLEGREYVEQALKQGKGVILLAMHYGSWELANLASAMMGYPYKVIVNPQKRYSRLDELLNSYRNCGGIVTIQKGTGTRDFIRSLNNNEVVAMVMDQGGRDGVRVPFFGRHASMSAGALRLALKMGVPICFAVMSREEGPYHRVVIHEPLELEVSGDKEKDIKTNVAKIARLMEVHINQKPSEYMWFYKIWKYSQDTVTVIIHDGRTGHLRQSQAVAGLLGHRLNESGIGNQIRILEARFKNRPAFHCVSVISWLAGGFMVMGRLGFLKWFLTPESFDAMMSVKPDFIVSCGSHSAGLNYLMATDQQAKSIVILKPGILGLERFDLAILPKHDRHPGGLGRTPVVITNGAPNLITPDYLEEQSRLLLDRYSHLKTCDMFKIGLLIGGDTKEFALQEKRIRIVIHQLMEVAEEINAVVLVTTSRRTTADVENMLQRELRRHPRCQLLILANRSNIPEAVGGILGLSEIVVVSGDSISMISEAASSGKKTIVFKPYVISFTLQRQKHDRFIEELHSRGYILSSDIKNLKRAVYDLAKNKIQTRKLDDHAAIKAALEKII